MKKLFLVFFLIFLAGALFFGGCSIAETKQDISASNDSSLVLMTWNVHNLFDGIDDGSEYNEFLLSSGWSAEKYLGRLNVLAAAIKSIKPLPDILLLQEIESLKILEDLGKTLAGGYAWSHFAGNPDAAVGLGILSRLPLTNVKAHSITVNGDVTPRPVLESRVETEEGNFVIFVCHWKSKIGGDEATEKFRRAAARVILRRIRELWEEEAGLGFIVAGDLNENHDEFYRRSEGYICALMPDDPYSARLTGCIDKEGAGQPLRQKDFFVLSKNKPPVPVHFPQDTIVFFTPWESDMDKGSYYYRNNWETIDHFLISPQFFNGSSWQYLKTETINYPPFACANEMPLPYNIRTGTGLSDHLPLLLRLGKKL